MNLVDAQHCTQTARVVVPLFLSIWIHIVRPHPACASAPDASSSSCTGSWPSPRLAHSVLIILRHAVHQAQRLAARNDRPLVPNAWHPFDTAASPVFELVYISQLKCTKMTVGTRRGLPVLQHGAGAGALLRRGARVGGQGEEKRKRAQSEPTMPVSQQVGYAPTLIRVGKCCQLGET